MNRTGLLILLFLQCFAAPTGAQTNLKSEILPELPSCSPADAHKFVRAMYAMEGSNAAGLPYNLVRHMSGHTGLTGRLTDRLASDVKPSVSELDQWIESYIWSLTVWLIMWSDAHEHTHCVELLNLFDAWVEHNHSVFLLFLSAEPWIYEPWTTQAISNLETTKDAFFALVE